MKILGDKDFELHLVFVVVLARKWAGTKTRRYLPIAANPIASQSHAPKMPLSVLTDFLYASLATCLLFLKGIHHFLHPLPFGRVRGFVRFQNAANQKIIHLRLDFTSL